MRRGGQRREAPPCPPPPARPRAHPRPQLRHGTLVQADDRTIAPLLTGQRHGPAPCGRTPGLVSDPATGVRLANQVPTGNPHASSHGWPRLAQVPRAMERATTPPRLRVHAVAGDLGSTDKARRQALHARGLHTVGDPTDACAPPGSSQACGGARPSPRGRLPPSAHASSRPVGRCVWLEPSSGGTPSRQCAGTRRWPRA